MASFYVLHSSTLDRFYTGSCKDFRFRLEEHIGKVYPRSFTSNSDDWKLFLLVEDLSYTQARAIELHVKKMKSNKYIQSLVKYPEMVAKLRDRFR
jgi:putative endonuclease